MELYPFNMPPFLRIQWRSKAVKDKYEPMFEKAKNIYRTLEMETVVRGFRHVTTDHVAAHDFDWKQQKYIQQGLVFVPMQKVGLYNGFASSHPPVVEGRPWSYYGVVADTLEHAQQFMEATRANDHYTLGKLLGYPECCLKAFQEVWLDQGYKDTVWQQANVHPETVREREGNRVRLHSVPWMSNNLLRAFGVGPIFHNKCSIHCHDTAVIAQRWIELAEELKLDGLAEMEMFLRMPMEWDAYKGIAFIKTPLFKASTNSVSCKERYQVQLEGTYFPPEGGRGLEFPWTEELVTMARNGNRLIYSQGRDNHHAAP